jgi:hypothetical protein
MLDVRYKEYDHFIYLLEKDVKIAKEWPSILNNICFAIGPIPLFCLIMYLT